MSISFSRVSAQTSLISIRLDVPEITNLFCPSEPGALDVKTDDAATIKVYVSMD